MEYELPPLQENPPDAAGPETAPEAAPAAAPPEPPPARRPRKRGWLHYLPPLLAGLICCAALILLATLAWGYSVYISKGYISDAGLLLPLYIFLGAIFLSSCLITALTRGGAIFPVLLFSLLANMISWLMAELPAPRLSGLLIKLLLSLFSAVTGFSLSKLLIIRRRR